MERPHISESLSFSNLSRLSLRIHENAVIMGGAWCNNGVERKKGAFSAHCDQPHFTRLSIDNKNSWSLSSCRLIIKATEVQKLRYQIKNRIQSCFF
jgi:hypothetical protein